MINTMLTKSKPQQAGHPSRAAKEAFQEKSRMSNSFIYSSPTPQKIQGGKAELLYCEVSCLLRQ